MTLAETQRAASAASPRAGANGLLAAPLHLNVNYGARRRRGGLLPRTMGRVRSLPKQMVGGAWDFNHRNEAESFLSSEAPVRTEL